MSEPLDTKHCVGCEDDFYNHQNKANGGCWCRTTAKIIPRKEVSINQVPPWDQKPMQLPSCYRKKGYIYVGPEVRR